MQVYIRELSAVRGTVAGIAIDCCGSWLLLRLIRLCCCLAAAAAAAALQKLLHLCFHHK